MTQIADSQYYVITVDPEDKAGYDVDVPVSFEVDDPTVATLEDVLEDDGTVNPKAKKIVSGRPGTTFVTVSVPTVEGQPDVTATEAVDVRTGGVALIKIVPGDPVEK